MTKLLEFEIKILQHVTLTENKLHSACAFTAFYSMNINSFILSICIDQHLRKISLILFTNYFFLIIVFKKL